jgi:hypothetical protein
LGQNPPPLIPFVAKNPALLKYPAKALLITKPNCPVAGKYKPVFKSPVNLSDGTAKEPLPNVSDVNELDEPEAAL